MRIAVGQVLGVVLVLAILAVSYSALLGKHGLAHLYRLRSERAQLREVAFSLLEGNAGLREQITRLKRDDRYLEDLARRQLGLVRPNETVYRFPRPTGPR